MKTTREEFLSKYGYEYHERSWPVTFERSKEQFFDYFNLVKGEESVMDNQEKSIIDVLIEEMDKSGSDFTSTNIEFQRNGKKYILVMGLNYAGEERLQQDDEMPFK